MKKHYTIHSAILTLLISSISSLYGTQPCSILAEIAAGELIDKITILQIKNKRITDSNKLKNVKTELEILQTICTENIVSSIELEELTELLSIVNEKLWDIEDKLREKEHTQLFDAEFIALARAVYINNDLRCRIKRTINKLCGSHIIEEKSYIAY